MGRLKEIIHESRHGVFLVTYALVLYYLCKNIGGFFDTINDFFGLLKPLLIGFCIAYVLNIPMARIEKWIEKNFENYPWVKNKSRVLAMTLTLVLAIVLVTILFFIIVPQLIDSIVLLLNNLGAYIDNIIEYIVILLKSLHIENEYINDLLHDLQNLPWNEIFGNVVTLVTDASDSIGDFATEIMNGTMNIAGKIGTFVTSFMIGLYLLSSKENYLRQLKNILLAFLGRDLTETLYEYGSKINDIFRSFIGGQLLEASILFGMYSISMMVLQMPYALLISALIAVTSIIPYFGAMLGSFVGFVLIFAINPLQAVGFFIYFQILQQIENNLIYPKVVGKSVGLPAIWVVLGILAFGSMFGITGMIVAVPTCAVLYQTFRTLIYALLKFRGINPKEEK